jgi:hypothetical protein
MYNKQQVKVNFPLFNKIIVGDTDRNSKQYSMNRIIPVVWDSAMEPHIRLFL